MELIIFVTFLSNAVFRLFTYNGFAVNTCSSALCVGSKKVSTDSYFPHSAPRAPMTVRRPTTQVSSAFNRNSFSYEVIRKTFTRLASRPNLIDHTDFNWNTLLHDNGRLMNAPKTPMTLRQYIIILWCCARGVFHRPCVFIVCVNLLVSRWTLHPDPEVVGMQAAGTGNENRADNKMHANPKHCNVNLADAQHRSN